MRRSEAVSDGIRNTDFAFLVLDEPVINKNTDKYLLDETDENTRQKDKKSKIISILTIT